MARDAREVTEFLRDLAARARASATDRAARLCRRRAGPAELQPWDVPYASERLRESRYAYSEDEVKQYFTERACWPACTRSSRPCSTRLVETPVSGTPTCVRVRVESPRAR